MQGDELRAQLLARLERVAHAQREHGGPVDPGGAVEEVEAWIANMKARLGALVSLHV